MRKKFTYLFAIIFIISMSGLLSAQTLPIDFSDPADDNFVGDGGAVYSLETVQFAPDTVGKIVGGTDQWNSRIDLDLATYIDVTTASKTFTFEFYTTEAVIMTGLFQISMEEVSGYPIEMQFTTDGVVGWQTITLDFHNATNAYPNAGLPVVYGQYARVSIFTNFGDTGTSTYYVDDIAGAVNGDPVTPQPVPTVPAPTPPARNAGDVISLFSDAYTNRPVDTWDADWGNVCTVADCTIAGDSLKRYDCLNFAGIDFSNNKFDASSMTHFHIDIWTPTDVLDKSLTIKCVDFGGGTSEVTNFLLTVTHTANGNIPALAQESWISIDLPITAFTGDYTRTDLAQLVLTTNLGTIYIDNLYFYRLPTAIGKVDGAVPSEYALEQNYPNPFNPTTNIRFSIPKANHVTLKVFNMLGQKVATLVDNFKNAGTFEVDFDAANLPSGTYFYSISAGNFNSIQKMLLIK